MIDPKQIPKEVVEAVEKVLSRYLIGGYTLDHKESIAGIITAAGLNAWPNVIPTSATDHLLVARPALVLPLPKDAADE
jgi:hypothetical protein